MEHRFNLWLVCNDFAKIICWGQHDEMNDIAVTAGLSDLGDIYVLPDQQEPDPINA